MNCPLCGKVYPCVHSRKSAETLVASESLNLASNNLQDTGADTPSPYGSIPVERAAGRASGQAYDQGFWRDQVASRVQQHRARRKGADADPNMELRFPVQEAPVDARIMRARRFVAQAAARSPFVEDFSDQKFSSGVIASGEGPAEDSALEEPPKVINFPRSGRSWTAQSLANVHDYHAAMVELESDTAQFESLRITDAGEETPDHAELDATEENGGQGNSHSSYFSNVTFVPDDLSPMAVRNAKEPPAEQLELPNFDDIQLEATHQPVLPDVELGPQPAPLGQRMLAGAVDAAIVLAAAAVFNVTFTQLAEETLHSRMALLCAFAVGGVLWTLYQYTFLVHGSGTPGMHLAQLELAKFDGKPVKAFDRGCRSVASALSGFSLGLGFLWALVDEDQLGWHDRITKTLIRSSVAQAVVRESVW